MLEYLWCHILWCDSCFCPCLASLSYLHWNINLQCWSRCRMFCRQCGKPGRRCKKIQQYPHHLVLIIVMYNGLPHPLMCQLMQENKFHIHDGCINFIFLWCWHRHHSYQNYSTRWLMFKHSFTLKRRVFECGGLSHASSTRDFCHNLCMFRLQ